MNAEAIARVLPLRWRLALVATGVLAVVLAIFGAILYVNLRSTLLDTTARGLYLSADSAVRQSAIGSPGRRGKGGLANLPAVLSPDERARSARGPDLAAPEGLTLTQLAQQLTNRDTAALTTDAHGNVVGDGPVLAGVPTAQAPRLDPDVYREVAAANQERHLRWQTPAGAVLVELIPLPPDRGARGGAVGVLQLSTSLRSVDTLLGRLRMLLVVGTLLALLATALLTNPLVRGVLRPLRRMAAASRAIAGGDLSRRVAVPAGGDELTDLARSFNAMVGRLEATLATQRRFIADASHELRSPLTAVGGGVEMLLLGADQGDVAARTKLLGLMEDEIARMGRLVDDLLQLTRFDAQPNAALQLAPVDLVALADEVVEATRLLAPDRHVALEVDAAPGAAIVVPGDADRLRQALLNLCANARAYTPPGGTIAVGVRLHAHRGGAEAILSVADTGAGIAPEDLPRVWDRFYRADPARARRAGQGGLGLGLAIVHAVVAAHGGRAAIASTPGAGTTVTLTLPGATASVPTPATSGAPTASPAAGVA